MFRHERGTTRAARETRPWHTVGMTEADLRRFAPILVHEQKAFVRAFERFKVMTDSTIECSWAGMATLVHYRCFIDFYFTSKRGRKHKEDVLAADYNAAWPLTPPLWIEEEKNMLNKMLAHLSISRLARIERQEHLWNINRIWYLVPIWSRFLNELPSDRKTWFLEAPSGT